MSRRQFVALFALVLLAAVSCTTGGNFSSPPPKIQPLRPKIQPPPPEQPPPPRSFPSPLTLGQVSTGEWILVAGRGILVKVGKAGGFNPFRFYSYEDGSFVSRHVSGCDSEAVANVANVSSCVFGVKSVSKAQILAYLGSRVFDPDGFERALRSLIPTE